MATSWPAAGRRTSKTVRTAGSAKAKVTAPTGSVSSRMKRVPASRVAPKVVAPSAARFPRRA